MNEETMEPEERVSLMVLNIKLNELVYTHPKIASAQPSSWRAFPPNVLTPSIVRGVIGQALKGLSRAKQIEEHVVARLKINGVAFLLWEQNISSMTDFGGKASNDEALSGAHPSWRPRILK